MRTLILTFISLVTMQAHAGGDRVGNGGNVVKCTKSIEVLDLYEFSEPLHDFKNTDYKSIVSEVVKNLERLNKSQAEQYNRRLKEFYESLDFKSDVALVDVKDSKHVFVPRSEDCKMMQIAIRRNVTSKVTKQFVIDEDLWKDLSERSKAGLVMHEVIYEHFFKLGEDNSSKARILNAYLFSEKALKDKSSDYWELITSLKVPIYK